MRDGLMALQAVGNELSLAPNTAELCRRAVELGRSRLGFERLGLWFTTDQGDVIEGSFGIDENGHLRDERGSTVPIRPGSPASRVLRGEAPSVAVADAPLRNNRGEVVGTGTHVVASLWNGRTVIGCLAADNFLSREEITASQQELLKLYASTLGHLCSLKQTEASLADREQQYRTLVENINVGIYRNTPGRTGKFLQANPALARIFGYDSVEEYLQTTVAQHYQDPADRKDLMDELHREGVVRNRLLRLRRKDGSLIWGSCTARAKRDGQGRVLWSDGIIEDITEQIIAQEALRRRDRILETVNFAAERFLRTPGWQEQIREVLAHLGGATEVSRTYIFRNHTAPDGGLYASLLYEWTAEGITPQIGNPQMQRFSLGETGLARWVEILSRGEALAGLVRNFPPAEQPLLAARDIRALVAVPIFCGEDWWGIIGFDECEQDRIWTDTEVDALKAAAGALGAAIQNEQAEAALRDSEKHLRTVIASAPVVLWELDRRGIITFAEGADTGRAGIPSAKDAVGRHAVEVAPRIDDFDDRMRRLLAGESITTTEEVGETTTESRQSPLRDAEGNITGVIGVSYDITDRIHAEQALRDSEERYRTLVQELPIAVIRTPVDDTARLLMANPAAAKMVGYDSVAELLQCTPQDLCDDPQLRRRMMHELIETGQVVDFECQLRNKDGSPVWAAMTGKVVRDTQDKPVYIDFLSRDITGQKRAEQALRESEEKYRTLVENAGEAISLVNADGEFLFMNNTAAERLGGTPADFIGKSMWALFPKKAADLQATAIQEVIATARGHTMEHLTVLQGQPRWYQTGIQPVRDHQGTVTSALVIARDVTDWKHAQAALQTAHARLVSARENERRRLAGDLHDSIGQRLVALQLLLDGTAHDPTVRQDAALAQRLADGSQGCRDLIRDVRGICHGLYPPTLESLGLVSALQPLVRRCRAAHVWARVRYEPSLEARRFEPDVEITLFRIAQEAVHNALGHGHAREIQIDLRQEDDEVSLTVTDDGAGFDTSRATAEGLGLTVMRERANAIGGQLLVESSPAGTTVHARLPLTGADGELANPPPAE